METKEYITARSFAIKALLAVISGKEKSGIRSSVPEVDGGRWL